MIILESPPPHPGEYPVLKPRDLPALRGEQERHAPRFVQAAWDWSKRTGRLDHSSGGSLLFWQRAARPSMDGRLFFVEREMVPLLLARAAKVPDNAPIMTVRRPAEAGMIIFGKTPAVWEHEDVIEGEKYYSPIDAFSWDISGDDVLTAMYVQSAGSILDVPGVRQRIGGPLPPWVMLCITQLPAPPEGDRLSALRLLTACWTLMGEKRVVESRTVQRHGKKARALERSAGGNPPVTVVNVRPGVGGRPAAPGAPGEGKPLACLVDVAGHYKIYHVGPGRTGRDLRWVKPHARGPEGAPRSETVRVLRPDRKGEK